MRALGLAIPIAAWLLGTGCGSRSGIDGVVPAGVGPSASTSTPCPAACPGACVSGRCVSPATLAAGHQHTCAVRADGSVTCWGSNGSEQLGNRTSAGSRPAMVPGVSGAVGVAAGFDFSCALAHDGTASCWGNDSNGQLGDGAPTALPNMTLLTGIAPVTGLTTGAAISAGYDDTCALRLDGTVACWGYGGYGQIGDGVLGDGSPTPSQVMQLAGAQAIASGAYFNCALLASGTVQCWGAVLGTGVDKDVSTPVAVPNLDGVVALSAGNGHTCAVLAGGSVACWGSNEYGELGFPTTATCLSGLTCSLAPTTLSGIGNVTALAAGSSHTCALLADTTVRCWGKNDHGQLGDGNAGTQSLVPVAVSGLSGVVEIAAGVAHSCARLATGAFTCWGANDSGQLGDGTTSDSPVPVPVAL
ncbi:MAG: RCC1 domain-containing protein [Polyangiaceae bacterium]